MKSFVYLLILFSLTGCAQTFEEASVDAQAEQSIPATAATVNVDKSSEITSDQQQEVKELIEQFFSALETKDYEKAINLQIQKTDQKTFQSNWGGIESIQLKSIKPYLFTMEQGLVFDIPEGKYTTNFMVELEIRAYSGMYGAWDEGLNTRFVNVEKLSDGSWRINGLATSP